MGSAPERVALEALEDPVLVWDAAGRVLWASGAAKRLFGAPLDALVGARLETLVPERMRVIDGLPIHEVIEARWREAPRVFRGPILRAEGVEIHRAFHRLSADGDAAVRFTVPEGEEEELDPLRLSELSASSRQEQHEATFAAAPFGIMHFDAKGVITDVNDAFVEQMGSSRALLIGLDMTTLPNRDVREVVRSALDGESARYHGTYVSVTGGRRREYRARFVSVRRGDEVEGGVAIVEDTTERLEIEARLVQGERMASLGRLAAGVAHEINNPLAYVRTSLELARRELGRDEEPAEVLRRVARMLDHADEGVERVRLIVRDLKTFSRGDEGSWVPVDLRRVADAAISLAWNELRHRAELVREMAPTPPVMGSESRFTQVLVNLLVNAAHAIDEGHAKEHRVTVRSGVLDEATVFIEVEDTGRGIDPTLVERVFEPFWTSKPKGVGTGLGLSICHGIVTSAGGEIRVARSDLGRGTVFRIELPSAPNHRAPIAAPAALPSTPPSIRARVLIVDDEDQLRRTLALALEDRFEVELASDGHHALRILESDASFDLVLCDLMMPDLGGIEVYERVSKSAPEVASRFVFMTGGAFTDRASEFLKSKGVRRLQKPFSIAQVEELLAGL